MSIFNLSKALIILLLITVTISSAKLYQKVSYGENLFCNEEFSHDMKALNSSHNNSLMLADVYSKNLKCSLCGRTFKKNDYFLLHISRNHSDDTLSFERNSNISIHDQYGNHIIQRQRCLLKGEADLCNESLDSTGNKKQDYLFVEWTFFLLIMFASLFYFIYSVEGYVNNTDTLLSRILQE
jgi:hypothetical protein